MRNAGPVWLLASVFSVVSHVAGAVIVSAMIERGTPQQQPVSIELSASDLGVDVGQAETVSDAEVASANLVEPNMAEPSSDAGAVASAQSDAVSAVDDNGSVAAVVPPETAAAAAVGEEAQVESVSGQMQEAMDNSEKAAPIASEMVPGVAASSAAVLQEEASSETPASDSRETVGAIAESGSADVVVEQDAAVVPDASNTADLPEASQQVSAVRESTSAAVATADQTAAAAVTAAVGETATSAADLVESASGELASAIEPEDVATPVVAATPVAAEPSNPTAVAVERGQRVEPAKPEPLGEVKTALVPPKPLGEVKTALALPKPPKPAPQKDSRFAIATFMKTEGSGRCFLAVPFDIRADGATVDGYAETEETISGFEARFEAQVDASLSLNRNIVSSEQCAALEMVNALAGSGERELALRIEVTEIADGEELVVDIRNVTMPWFTLLLVDDDGMAVNLSRFVIRVGDVATFRKPMHLLGNGLGHPQLLIALSASERLDLADFKGQRPSNDVIPLVLGEKITRKLETAIAIASFRVR